MAKPNEEQNTADLEPIEKESPRGLLLSPEIAAMVDEMAEYESRSFKNAAEQLIRYGIEKFRANRKAIESINMAS